MSKKYVVYYDEAGRGPLAGGVFCGLSIKLQDFNDEIFDDSKKLTDKKRFDLEKQILELDLEGKLCFGIGMASAEYIDNNGIIGGIKLSISQALICLFERLGVLNYRDIEDFNFGEKLKYICDNFVEKIVLDGNSDFGLSKIVKTETIIKGDSLVKMIGISSILAKCSKDREMLSLGLNSDFEGYGFENNKGYGTKSHIEAIKEKGLTRVHRKTFCKSLK